MTPEQLARFDELNLRFLHDGDLTPAEASEYETLSLAMRAQREREASETVGLFAFCAMS